MKRTAVLYVAAAGLAGAIVAIAPVTWRIKEVAVAQPAHCAVVEAAPEAKVTPLFSKDLKEFPGKEGVAITVEYPPGAVDPVHRHYAHTFVHVLEGSIVMQLKGDKGVTLKPGDTYYEGPDDIHTVGRNASETEPAKFVAFLVKEKGAPLFIPEK